VRADALHTFTARLARAHSVVVVEDLKTRNLMANHSLAQAIGDQGWGELARQWATRRSATAGSCWSRTDGSRRRRRARRAVR
jgi:putative transposase